VLSWLRTAEAVMNRGVSVLTVFVLAAFGPMPALAQIKAQARRRAKTVSCLIEKSVLTLFR
jgi:hypothetical protein